MNRWQFRSYIKNGRDEVRLWYDVQPPSVRAELLTIVMYLRDEPLESWTRPDYDELHGKLASLGELRVIMVEHVGRVHYRVLGFMNEEALEFTMLAADRKSRRFSYEGIGAIALNRKTEVLSNRQLFSTSADWIFDD